MLHGMKEAFEAGGWPMYVNLCLSAIVIAIVVERVRILFIQGRRLHKEHFMTQLTGMIVRGDYQRGISYCDALSTPMSRIIKARLIAAPKSDEETQAAM